MDFETSLYCVKVLAKLYGVTYLYAALKTWWRNLFISKTEKNQKTIFKGLKNYAWDSCKKINSKYNKKKQTNFNNIALWKANSNI